MDKLDYSGYSWIKVDKYQISPEKSWEERYKELESHHVQETLFLIKEIRKLADEINNAR